MLVLSKRNGTFKLFRVERYYGYESLVVECRKRVRNGMEADMNVVPKLRLGKTKIIWQVCTAPMRNDILIGLDLLKEVDSIIISRQGNLLIKDELILGRYRKETQYQISRVTVAMETTL